jgi:hypothetical protein
MKKILVVALAVACSDPVRLPSARFANAPPVLVVNDRLDVPRLPSTYHFIEDPAWVDATIIRAVTRPLELPRSRRALGVNSLDEVPDSTWFTNRISAHDLTPEQIFNGPATIDSPEAHTPWTVLSTKTGGTSMGFVIKDARGIKYLIKFDNPVFPELESSTHVVVNRLMWASGYHVAEDHVVFVRPDDLVPAPDAVVMTQVGRKHGRFDAAELKRYIKAIGVRPDGRIRALSSRWLPGKALGSPDPEGVRKGDPNDRIPHQLRRDLRGQYTVLSWLDHIDDNRGNSVDFLVTDPRDDRRHYVEHYFIDFGASLGAMAAIMFDLRHGHVYSFDYGDVFRSVFTLGIGDRPWGHYEAPRLRGVALAFTAQGFDPGGWTADIYAATLADADRFDKFWGAKIVARFTREQIAAAVEAAHYSDPRAAAYVVDTLVGRQRRIMAYWFARVNPLDHFTTTAAGPDTSVCFDDLAIAGELASATSTHYATTTYDVAGHPLSAPRWTVASADPHGRTCSAPFGLTDKADGYTIVRITTARPGFTRSTLVHVARDAQSGAPRVIGIWRE